MNSDCRPERINPVFFRPDCSLSGLRYMLIDMTAVELHRALKHCHTALGESLMVIGDMLNQKGNPDEIIRTVEDAQAKYNAIAQLLRDIEE